MTYPARIRTTTKTTGKTAISDVGDAKSGAVPFEAPDLAAISEAWPRLPQALKDGILAMVRAASG